MHRLSLKKTTIQEVLEELPRNLDPIFGDPLVDIELLLQHILKCDRTYLYTHLTQPLTYSQRLRLKKMYAQRKKNIPPQYSIGTVIFGNSLIKVTRHVLIPRPETLDLIPHVLHYLETHAIRNIVEIGTGSGALIIELAQQLKKSKLAYNFIATDISKKAIYLARFNALKNKITSINFRVRNLLYRPNTFIPLTSWILISNPPYVAQKDLDEPSIAHEPQTALDGGEDGLNIYDTLLQQVSLLQNKPKAIFFEIGESQGDAIHLLTQKYLEEYTHYAVHKDFAGKDRYVEIHLS